MAFRGVAAGSALVGVSLAGVSLAGALNEGKSGGKAGADVLAVLWSVIGRETDRLAVA